MASQVVIDSKSIGEQIVAGIVGSIDRVSGDIVSQGDKQAKRLEERPLDIREQILDNARTLWGMIDSISRQSRSYITGAAPRTTPAMVLVVVGEGNAISAGILRQRFDNLSNVRNQQPDIIFMSSMETDTVEKALCMLLELTMAMLNKRADDQMFGEGEWVEQANGGYYAPTSTSI
ncbi:hypothetical protein LTR56_024059 [Elasticomyces elasticus]|nr:hypothetical protein LTR56_024059 [Elasticomyces elasticus]KAK3666624.1 hypothetical protein LTR22_002568 [Elasticomyces elasticus]KAK4921683.1 hypothetical protein LTR49_010974 [Elasticomyces elasticus]KAK5758627.1 hypothetical protein LTS12_011331 [Elasticomyces elasticus]